MTDADDPTIRYDGRDQAIEWHYLPDSGYMLPRPDEPRGQRIWDDLRRAVFSYQNVRWKAHVIGSHDDHTTWRRNRRSEEEIRQDYLDKFGWTWPPNDLFTGPSREL